LDQFEVSIARGEQAALLSSNDNPPEELLLVTTRIVAWLRGLVAAFAVQGHGWKLKCLQRPEYFPRTITQDSTLPYQD